MEDTLEERVQETADHLLSNAVGDCGNTQGSGFPCVSFGDVDTTQRKGLIRPILQATFERFQILPEVCSSVQIDGDAIDARSSSVASNATEGFPKELQVDTTCQGMCFDPGQSRVLQQKPMERRTGRFTCWGLRRECFLATLLSPGRPDDPDAGPFWERLTIPVKSLAVSPPTTVSPFGLSWAGPYFGDAAIPERVT